MCKKFTFVAVGFLMGCLSAFATTLPAAQNSQLVRNEQKNALRLAQFMKRTGPECRPVRVAEFINNGGNPDSSVNGTRLLNYALLEGADDCALALLHHGASVDFETPIGPFIDIALSITAWAKSCDPEAIDELVKRGADPNGHATGDTPLFRAALAKNVGCAAALIKAGARVNALIAPRGMTALMGAQMMGPRGNGNDTKDREQMTRLLLNHGANPNVAQKDIPGGHEQAGVTAIFFAASLAHSIPPCPVCVSDLIKHGANPNATDAQGDTPLLWTLSPKHRSSVATVTALIRGGANVNLSSSKAGKTPLMAAAAQGSTAIVNMLLKYGADRCALDKSKRSASTYARKNGHSKLAQAVACRNR